MDPEDPPVAADSDSRNRRWCRAYASTSADHFSSWLCRVVAFGCRVKNGGKWYSRGNSKAGGPPPPPCGAGLAAAAGGGVGVGVGEMAEELGFGLGFSVVVVVVVCAVGSGVGEGDGDGDAAVPSPGDDVAEDSITLFSHKRVRREDRWRVGLGGPRLLVLYMEREKKNPLAK